MQNPFFFLSLQNVMFFFQKFIRVVENAWRNEQKELWSAREFFFVKKIAWSSFFECAGKIPGFASWKPGNTGFLPCKTWYFPERHVFLNLIEVVSEGSHAIGIISFCFFVMHFPQLYCCIWKLSLECVQYDDDVDDNVT